MLSKTPEKGIQETPVVDLLSLERAFSMPQIMQPEVPNMDLKKCIALSTDLGYIIMADDTVNACAQAPTLDEPLYVIFHDYYRYWYRDKHGIEIPSVFIAYQYVFMAHLEDVSLCSQLFVSLL